jgi:[acyl-carrier-protein] S-malonyltransferase
MAQACEQKPGAMLALLGCDNTDVNAFCDEVLTSLNAEGAASDAVLVPANFNAPTQIVVSGSVDAIDAAEASWKELGKKCARLATAGAFHSPLMADAADEVGAFCEGLTFSEPACVVLCNTDAQPLTAADAAVRLKNQVKSGVKFSQSIEALANSGHTEFVEVGYGKVLSGLVRKIDKTLTRKNVGTLQEFQAFFE